MIMNGSTSIPTFRQMFSMPWALFLPVLPILVFSILGFLYSVHGYRTPEEIPYWTLVFGMPHIVSSFQTACDKEYLSLYGLRALRVAGLAMLPVALYALGASPKIMLAVNFVWTVYHVIAQQYGIAFGAARLRPSLLSSICKWCTVVLGIMAYMQVSLYPDLNGDGLYKTLSGVAADITMPLLIVMIVAGGILIWQARAIRVGALLLGFNLLLFVLALVLIFKTPYVLVGLMLVRVLHDVTGFVAYIWHDTVRNRNERKNVLYRAFPFLPVWFLNPILAVVIAAGLTRLSQDMIFFWWVMIGLNIAHYHMESFIWKQGTPHRRHFGMASS